MNKKQPLYDWKELTDELRREASFYQYRVGWDKENEAFLATVLEQPDLMAHGETIEEALHEIQILVASHLENTEDRKWMPVPWKVFEKGSSE